MFVRRPAADCRGLGTLLAPRRAGPGYRDLEQTFEELQREAMAARRYGAAQHGRSGGATA